MIENKFLDVNLQPGQPIFSDTVELIRQSAQNALSTKNQVEYGQYFTNIRISTMMASMFKFYKNEIRLLDPGAGSGILTAAFVSQTVNSLRKPRKLFVTCFEIDTSLIPHLKNTLEQCESLCKNNDIEFKYEIKNEDFIEFGSRAIFDNNSLFQNELDLFDYAILNPPYKKILSFSRTKQQLHSINIDTTNLYTAFVWLACQLLHPLGELVAITPRSFCNGTYFLNFRKYLLSSITFSDIHIFESRDKAFSDSDVLQENIIFHVIKKRNANEKVEITSSDNPDDADVKTRSISHNELINPNDNDLFIRIDSNNLGKNISASINSLPCKLEELDLAVSTGKLVDFRSKELLRKSTDDEVIPLLYAFNIVNGKIKWPNGNNTKPEYLASTQDSAKFTIPINYYVLVKRFSSKEERKRIYAGYINPTEIPANRIAIENHLNYFYSKYGELNEPLAKGLTAFLNSSIVDEFFRQFSGHTQVNASDLKSLRYPTRAQLMELGNEVNIEAFAQSEIDSLLNRIVFKKEEDSMGNDPIKAKNKIKEALHILQSLNVPRQQQNDRSALTLLALLNLHPNNAWKDVNPILIGITEMMDFFRENYGVDYKPNSRETVRRQTIHQFIQLGLVNQNPDDPKRPVNSPDNRYIPTNDLVNLVKKYNTPDWKTHLSRFIEVNPNLTSLQLRERPMELIPVKLPDGNELVLTSGGQNELIKKIIEEFCPRYTPNGKLIYIGDAGKKISEIEIQQFKNLGITIDIHGKMPDLVIEIKEKEWLVIIEAVTSHGPIDIKRHIELNALFGESKHGLVFVTAFDSRKVLNKYLGEIDWETEVWVAESPSHLIHFDGEKFLGPY